MAVQSYWLVGTRKLSSVDWLHRTCWWAAVAQPSGLLGSSSQERREKSCQDAPQKGLAAQGRSFQKVWCLASVARMAILGSRQASLTDLPSDMQ